MQHTCSFMARSVEAGSGSFAWPVEPECNTLDSDQFFDDPGGTFFIRVKSSFYLLLLVENTCPN